MTQKPVGVVDVGSLGKLKFQRMLFPCDPDPKFGVHVHEASALLGEHLDGFVGDGEKLLLFTRDALLIEGEQTERGEDEDIPMELEGLENLLPIDQDGLKICGRLFWRDLGRIAEEAVEEAHMWVEKRAPGGTSRGIPPGVARCRSDFPQCRHCVGQRAVGIGHCKNGVADLSHAGILRNQIG